jgi:hypothetical protein
MRSIVVHFLYFSFVAVDVNRQIVHVGELSAQIRGMDFTGD